MSEPIQVWRFSDAPSEYRTLSENGGDEDWVALVPKSPAYEYVSWLEPGSPFGWCNVEIHDIGEFWIAIGCHA